MTASIIGSLGMIFLICGIGGGLSYLLLFRTKLFDSVPLRSGLTAGQLRKYFRYGVLLAAIPAAIIGWIAGPILAEAFQ